MTKRITSPIKTFSVVKPETPSEVQVTEKQAEITFVQMHEGIDRPEALQGQTYKIKSPLVEHALYVTINDIILNEGTPHEQRRPFEIFINSKSMEHFQWIVCLTRILSAVFRKGGDVVFLIEEMKAVFDPKGGYFKSGGIYMPSVVAELGYVVEQHLLSIGMIQPKALSAEQQQLIASKAQAVAAQAAAGEEGDSAFPKHATMCPKCSNKSVVIMDGCQTCLNCAHSKCG